MIGLMESILGCSAVTRNSAAAGLLKVIEAVPASTRTVRRVWGASTASVTGTVSDRPSAATVGAPTVIPVFGENCTAVTPCNSNPWTVRVKLSPMDLAAGVRLVATLPKLTPRAEENRLCDCDDGVVVTSLTTPRIAETIGVKLSRISFTIVKVLADDGVASETPPGVVTMTVRRPIGAVGAMASVVVKNVPSALTLGALPAVMPVLGEKVKGRAPCKFLPLTVTDTVLPGVANR